MNQSKKVASLTTTRLSPLAKPFTLNSSSTSSVLSSQKPCISSLDHCNNDPFNSLLDSFKKSNLGSNGDTVTRTFGVGAASQNPEKSLFEQYPSLDFQKDCDFDWLNWSHFETVEESKLPTFSAKVPGNEVSYGKQEVDLHETLFAKGSDAGNSVNVGGTLQIGKHVVDGLNSCLATSDGTFKNGTGTIHAADEFISFLLPNCNIAPVKLSKTDISAAAKLTSTPQNQFSSNLGDSDSDVDSPCWRGTKAFCLTSSENSDSVIAEKATEKHNSLNPLAPQFFPGSGYVKDYFVPSNYNAPAAVNLLSGEDILMKNVAAESPGELNKGVELKHSSNIYGIGKTCNMFNESKSYLVDATLNSHCIMSQLSSKIDCSTSKGKQVTVVDVDGFVNGTKYPRASESASMVFPVKGHSPTPSSTMSSSRAACVPDLFKTHEGSSKSLIESPKPDVQKMVSAMHALSEMLVQTCVDGVDTYNEHDPDIIQQIIDNLNVFSTQKFGTDRSSVLPKNFKGLEVASVETQTVPHKLHVQNGYMGKNSVSKVFAEPGQMSFTCSSRQGTENSNEFAQLQVIRRSLGKSMDFEKQINPEALLFWNLWLDSEAERCYRRYKTYRFLMEAGIDVTCANVAELWR